MNDDEKAKTDEGPSEQEEQETAQPPTGDKKQTLRDFRTAVEEHEDVQESEENGAGGETEQKSEPSEPPLLNPVNRKVVRCASCGHFLFEIIAERAYVRAICRQGECKAQNEVTVENKGKRNSLHIEITPKEARQMGTVRV